MTSASRRPDKRRRTYVRLLGEIHHALNQALNEEKEKRGLNKTEIGKLLGLGRSAISKKFDGRHNMTLETLADLAFALDRPVKVLLPERPSAAFTNKLEDHSRSAAQTLGSITAALAQPAADQGPGQDQKMILGNIQVRESSAASAGAAKAPVRLASIDRLASPSEQDRIGADH